MNGYSDLYGTVLPAVKNEEYRLHGFPWNMPTIEQTRVGGDILYLDNRYLILQSHWTKAEEINGRKNSLPLRILVEAKPVLELEGMRLLSSDLILVWKYHHKYRKSKLYILYKLVEERAHEVGRMCLTKRCQWTSIHRDYIMQRRRDGCIDVTKFFDVY